VVPEPGEPVAIKTLQGIGYVLEAEPAPYLEGSGAA